MDLDSNHKEELIKRLTRNLLDAMEKNEIGEDDLPAVADFILEKVDKAQNHAELIALLDELSAKWTFFDNIEQLERGEVKESAENNAEKDVLSLVKGGKVEEAIKLSKSVMGV